MQINMQRPAAGRLGITGLADVLVMLGLTYGEERALSFARDLMRSIFHAAYRASIALPPKSFPKLRG